MTLKQASWQRRPSDIDAADLPDQDYPLANVLQRTRPRLDWNVVIVYAALIVFSVAIYMLANWS